MADSAPSLGPGQVPGKQSDTGSCQTHDGEEEWLGCGGRSPSISPSGQSPPQPFFNVNRDVSTIISGVLYHCCFKMSPGPSLN